MKMKKFLAIAMAMCMIFSMTTAAFAAGDGTEASPEVLTELTGGEVSFAGGSEIEYYYYTYTVPSTVEGIVMYTFSVDSANAYFILNVDNLTTGEYCQMLDWAWSDPVTTAGIKASAGDELQIRVQTVANDSVYEALDLTWSAVSASVGTASSPEVIETLSGWNGYQLDATATVVPNTDGYYYSYVAEVTGTLSLYINESATVDPWVEYPDWYEDDPLLVDDINDLAAEVVLTNKTTNAVDKLSEGTTELVVSTGYGSETYQVIQVAVTAGDEISINLSSGAEGYTDGVTMVCGLLLQEPYGSAGNPVVITKNNTEVEIPAGATYFISLEYPFMNYPCSIIGDAAVVLDYYGIEMEGTEDLVIEPVSEGWDTYYKFQIKNTGSTAVTYTISFDMPVGIEQNPEVLDTNDTKEHTFEVDDTSRYFYTWTAEADGIVYFTVDSDASWWYSVDNLTTGIWAPVISSVDDEIVHIAMDVSKGDELSVYVSAMNYDDYTVAETTKVTTTVEFVPSIGSIVDVDYVTEITDGIWNGDYDENGMIELDMTNEDGSVATVIPAEILNAIADYNTMLVNEYSEEPIVFTLVLDMGEYSWKITNITGVVPVDLGIDFEASNTDEDVIDAMADGDDYITFEIGHDGAFTFDAQLTFKVDTKYAGKTAALYWDNNGTLTLVGEKCTVADDGTVVYAFTHASDYVLIIEDTAVEEETTTGDTTTGGTTTEQSPNTADMTSVGALLLVAALAAVVVLNRKKYVEE